MGCVTPAYRPRDAEHTVLDQTIALHLEAFLVTLGLRSIDLAMPLPGRASSTTFSHEPYAEGKGVARVWALAESILEMVNLALASGRERVVTQQGLHNAGVVVAASKQYGSAHVTNHRLPLHIATHARRLSARISDDYLLIQLPDERRLDGEFLAACES
jgi:hypothetical protein